MCVCLYVCIVYYSNEPITQMRSPLTQLALSFRPLSSVSLILSPSFSFFVCSSLVGTLFQETITTTTTVGLTMQAVMAKGFNSDTDATAVAGIVTNEDEI